MRTTRISRLKSVANLELPEVLVPEAVAVFELPEVLVPEAVAALEPPEVLVPEAVAVAAPVDAPARQNQVSYPLGWHLARARS